MVGGVGWGSPFSRVFSGFSCSGSVFSPKAELRRWRRWESWRESGTAAGVKLSRRRLGWGRCRWAGVRRLCATALKLCVMRSLLFPSLSPSLSPSVSAGRCRGCCSLETVGGWEIGTAGRGRLGGSWSLGWGRRFRAGRRGAGCFLSCWGFFSLSGALGVSCCCWGFASPAVLGLAGDTLGGVDSCWALIWGAPGLGLGFVKLHKFNG